MLACGLVALAWACGLRVPDPMCLGFDDSIRAASAYPSACEPARVGTYPGITKSGAGYFYDDVLEYRVWVHSPEGGDDSFRAFAQWEPAEAFSKTTEGAESVLALVRQREWIDEPEPGTYEVKSGERITEWAVEWLAATRRGPTSIADFLEAPRAPRKASTAPR